MARTKKEEETKEEKQDIKKELENTKKEIKKELLNYIEETKKEISSHIDSEVRKEFADILERKYIKEINRKTRKLVFKDILILLLLIAIGYLCIIVYTDKGMKGFIINVNVKDNKSEVVEKNKKVIDKKEPTLDELKEKYASYLDYYYLSENSIYLENLYNKEYNEPLKLNYVMNNLDFSKFEIEDDYYVIDIDIFAKKYKELFNEEFKPINFDYNGNKIRYFNKLESFVTNTTFDKELSNINREIVEIKEDNKMFTITTIEGIINNQELYNPKTKELITDEYEGNYLDYIDSLEKVTYVFENNKLIRID